MKKKITALVAASVLMFALGTTVFAASSTKKEAAPDNKSSVTSCCGGMMSGGYGMMMDEDGKMLPEEDFEKKLNEAVEDGSIRSDEKESYLKMYDYCAEAGTGSRGRGMMGGCGR